MVLDIYTMNWVIKMLAKAHEHKEEILDVAEYISNLFDWETTKQGKGYWEQVCINLREIADGDISHYCKYCSGRIIETADGWIHEMTRSKICYVTLAEPSDKRDQNGKYTQA